MKFTEDEVFYFEDIKCRMLCTRIAYNSLECNSLEPNFKVQMSFEFNDNGMTRVYYDPHIQKSYNEHWDYQYHGNDGFLPYIL